MNQARLKQNVNIFIQHISSANVTNVATSVTEFLSNGEARQVMYDQGQILFIDSGKQVSALSIDGNTDRVVAFDGDSIREINPFAFIENSGFHMKGDDSSSTKRRRSGSSSGISSNNNNNNNNG